MVLLPLLSAVGILCSYSHFEFQLNLLLCTTAPRNYNMEISLQNYTTTLAKTFLAKAAKLVVRECDETEKGHFVAYVDEGDESYDVSLTLSAKGLVTGQSCDCKKGQTFCLHKGALLLHLAEKGKTPVAKKSKATPKSKLPPSVQLLAEVEELPLKAWVQEVLLRNKDLEMAFVHHFTAQQRQYTPKEVEQITKDAIKAVVKNKRTVDTSELKRIVELWTDVHAVIVKQYLEGVADENNFANLQTLIDCCLAFDKRTNNNSNKISRYIEDTLRQCLEPVNILQTDTVWEKATGLFINHLVENGFMVRTHYLLYLQNLCAISSLERIGSIAARIVSAYKQRRPNAIYNENTYTKMLFELVQQHKLLAAYYPIFAPIHFENTYNEALIKALIEIEQFALAEQYSRQQITGNSRNEYNIAYLQLLKTIYTQQHKQKELIQTLNELLPLTFNFDDYLYIDTHLAESEEKSDWRTKLQSKAKTIMGRGNRNAAIFCMQLYDHLNKPLKMIECLVNDPVSYQLILQHFDKMAKANTALLLESIILKSGRHGWSSYHYENDDAYFPALLAKLEEYIPRAQLLTRIVKEKGNKYAYHGYNSFWSYVVQQLQPSNQ